MVRRPHVWWVATYVIPGGGVKNDTDKLICLFVHFLHATAESVAWKTGNRNLIGRYMQKMQTDHPDLTSGPEGMQRKLHKSVVPAGQPRLKMAVGV